MLRLSNRPRLASAVALGLGLSGALGGAALLPSSGAAAGATAYTVTTLHFKTVIGPADAPQTCDVVGDLYRPATATATTPAPAVLSTNGFGGSKDSQAGVGKFLAGQGYVVLAYSGLGFGGSQCKISLDDPDYDGKAASQLVSYLGGQPGIAYADADHTQAAPVVDFVTHDAKDHDGKAQAHDPRVGMIGGSYGGAIQLAAAAIDHRVDTIVPMITWNDLSYSLDPNNTAQTASGQVSTTAPGAIKLNWGLGFSALGMEDGLTQAGVDPNRLYPCPNFQDFVCEALVTAGSTGYFQDADVPKFRHASPVSYLSSVKIPTLLMQGENDTLFNLNEAVATYRTLQAQKVPVKMVWHSWGHSGPSAPGDIDLDNPDPTAQYETGRVLAWFDHYLKGTAASTGPQFAYFRDWVSYTGNASPAYGTSSSFPVGTARTYRLSGTSDLTTGTPAAGSQTIVTPPAGAPTSFNTLDVLSGYAQTDSLNGTDVPGTVASWSTPPLTTPLNVVGSPVATLTVSAPTAAASQLTGPAGELVLFVKVADVGPDGKPALIHGLEAPVRVPDVNAPIKVTLPAIVHRFEAGHRLELIVSGGSGNYRGGLVSAPVTISSGAGQTLVLPVS